MFGLIDFLIILQLVKDSFVQDLEQAILLSKIDFEEQKATEKILAKERAALQALQVAKKPTKMSLDQFNQLEPQEITGMSSGGTDMANVNTNTSDTSHSVRPALNIDQANGEDNFFEKVQQDTRNILNREQVPSRNMSVVSIYIRRMTGRWGSKVSHISTLRRN